MTRHIQCSVYNPGMIPDAETAADPTPAYIRDLIRRTSKSSAWCARRIGVGERYLRHLTDGTRVCSYAVQFALESLADEIERAHQRGDDISRLK